MRKQQQTDTYLFDQELQNEHSLSQIPKETLGSRMELCVLMCLRVCVCVCVCSSYQRCLHTLCYIPLLQMLPTSQTPNLLHNLTSFTNLPLSVLPSPFF